MYTIRGAITVEFNTVESISGASVKLISAAIKENNLCTEDIAAIIFSTTADLTAQYPAKAVREKGFNDVSLFSCVEPQIDASLEKCIRILIFVDLPKQTTKKHIYLEGAQALRKDLFND